MTKKFNFVFNEGKYILQYNNPNDTKEPFEISAEDMQFDTKNFYQYVFSDIKEKTTIEIHNIIQKDVVGADVAKKGERVYQVINDLCKEIIDKINTEVLQG